MTSDINNSKELYFTDDHEWIDFQGRVAYLGVSGFKLTGFKDIQQINFRKALGSKLKGESIVTIHYSDYQIDVHMPVNGKVLEVNEKLAGQEKYKLLQDPESRGWIALIIPDNPRDRKGLIRAGEYKAKRRTTSSSQ
jgi:glycine cleavage system H protein